jgi:hypothetical protein
MRMAAGRSPFGTVVIAALMRPAAARVSPRVRGAVGFGMLHCGGAASRDSGYISLTRGHVILVEEGLMTDTPPEPPDVGPEGPVQEDDPPTEPDGGPERGPSPQWA